MRPARKAAIKFIALALGAVVTTAAPGSPKALPVTVGLSQAEVCEIRFAGQAFSLPNDDERMIAEIRKLRRYWRSASLSVSGEGDTPYRCIGGVIYLFQRAGFNLIEFRPGSQER